MREVVLSKSRLKRLVLLGSVCATTLVAGYVGWDAASQVAKLKMKVALLELLKFSYMATCIAVICGACVIVFLLIRTPGLLRRNPWVARASLLCVSLMVGILACEGGAAVIRATRSEMSAVPNGGFRNADFSKHSMPENGEVVNLPTEFPEAKEPEDVDIIVLGESSAAGVPYSHHWISPLWVVQWRLEREIRGKRFHVNVIAKAGDTLEKQHRALAEIERKPDLVVIYCGHNEFSARLSASRELNYYFDSGKETAWEKLLDRVETVSPFCGLIRNLADTFRISIPPPAGGYRSLVDSPVYTRSEYDALLSDFRRRLEAIIAYTERIGAIPLLIVPPANDADLEPNRSFLPPETPYAERLIVAREHETAHRLEASDPDESVRRYRLLAERYPGFAETRFRLGRLAEQAGQWEEAYRQFSAARDLDGAPIRCLTAFQDVYRELAAKHRCMLIDGQKYFHSIARNGLLDDELFHDGMHPSLRGLLALAEAILRELHAKKLFGWPEGAPIPKLEIADVLQRFPLGRGEWSRLCHFGIMFYGRAAPARYDPSERLTKQDAFGKAADRIDAGTPPELIGLPNIGIPEAIASTPKSAPSTGLVEHAN